MRVKASQALPPINRRRLLKLFLQLVRTPSVSKEERPAAELVKRELRKVGYHVREDGAGIYIGGNCGNLYAFVPGTVKRAKRVRRIPRILFNAHLDHNVPGKNIRPLVRKGMITSDGTTILGGDDKAGVAAILEMVTVLKERKVPHGDLELVFTVAEEIGLRGAKQLNRRWLKADFGYAVDGSQVHVVLNRGPSQDSLEATVIGKAAHAGVHPEKGINAIHVVSRAIAHMRLGRVDRETTANIGVVQGGVAANIVPERVKIIGEARSQKLSKLRRQVHRMEAALSRACSAFKAQLQLKVAKVYRSFFLKENAPVVRTAVRAIRRLGLRPEIRPTGGGSDAHVFNNVYGIPTAILGIGTNNVHTVRESLPVENLGNATRLLIAIVMDAASQRRS